MTQAERLAELRELFMSAPEAASTRAVALIGSLLLVAFVLWLVRRRTLREEYTPIWLAIAVGVAALSVVNPLLHWLTRAIGAWTPSSALFFFGQVMVLTFVDTHKKVVVIPTIVPRTLCQSERVFTHPQPSGIEGDRHQFSA